VNSAHPSPQQSATTCIAVPPLPSGVSVIVGMPPGFVISTAKSAPHTSRRSFASQESVSNARCEVQVSSTQAQAPAPTRAMVA
jgi:hypothetical protein